MFNWLWRWLECSKSTKVRATGFTKDSWERAKDDAFYIVEFKEALDRVATILGMTNEFNAKLGCAELARNGKLVTRVTVSNDNGTCEAIVLSRESLPYSTKEVLKSALRPLNVNFQ